MIKEPKIRLYDSKYIPTRNDIFDVVLKKPDEFIDISRAIKRIDYSGPLNGLELSISDCPEGTTDIYFDAGYTNDNGRDQPAMLEFYNKTERRNENYEQELEAYQEQERIYAEQIVIYADRLKIAQAEDERKNLQWQINQRKIAEKKLQEFEHKEYLRLKAKYEVVPEKTN